MEEDECDYGTPIGQVIKQINCLRRKPPIDNQLGNAIDLFHERLNEQEKYLVNGIFRINFAESALFLQSCAELYAKKIDVLWNELLEFHTRLIRYDCEHQKEEGIPLNEEAIKKLEERRNRNLRKKKFKLLQEAPVEVQVHVEVEHEKPIKHEVENAENEDFLIEEDEFLLSNEEKLLPLDEDVVSKFEENGTGQNWTELESESKPFLKVPYIVYVQKRRTYRLSNYPIHGPDFDIIDTEDGEFNTKYSRVPGWHYIYHLIEYNNKGLLPDSKSAIARLKLGLHGRLMFLKKYKLPMDTNLDDYKEEFEEFCNQYLKDEAKRWQNMPLDTIEDFRKQLQFLTKMCQEDVKNERRLLRGMGHHQFPAKIENSDNSDEDSIFEFIGDDDKNVVKSDLFVRLEKLSCEVVNTKLRQDSGYFDRSTCSDEQNNSTGDALVNNEGKADGTNENGVNGASVSGECENTVNPSESTNDDGNFDTRSAISDYDYGHTPTPVVASKDDGSDGIKTKCEKTVRDVFKKPLGPPRIIPKAAKRREPRKKRIAREVEKHDSTPKRRKLSQKQIDALLKGKIAPVKLMIFEKFFSENYQSDEGEGNVPSVDYDSDDEADDADLDLPNDDHAIQDDIRSDHSYCQPLPNDTQNDSGFVELSQTNTDEEQIEFLPDIRFDRDEDVERMAAEVRKQMSLNKNKPVEKQLVPWVPTEADMSEIEYQESQQRVEDWRNNITPILRNLKENDFDIHEYGSQIIEGLDVNESKPFKDFVQGKKSAEVVRYFISSLQLANTNNVEICDVVPGQLSNDTCRIKLLSRDRYHEHLKNYLAPSEETLAEKLERVRAMAGEKGQLGSKTKSAKATDKTYKGKQLPCGISNKKMMVKLIKLPNSSPTQRVTEETMNHPNQHNKENHNIETPTLPVKVDKGKRIVKRQTNTPRILNFDISLPSTSRQSHWFDQPHSSVTDPQMPSTSWQAAGELPGTSNGSPPDDFGASPNKRRWSDSSEETFARQLATTQLMNPDIQVHSTPHGPSPSKLVKFSSASKKTILF